MNRYKQLVQRFAMLLQLSDAVPREAGAVRNDDRAAFTVKCEEFLTWTMDMFPGPVTDDTKQQMRDSLTSANLIDVLPAYDLSGFSDPVICALAVRTMMFRKMPMDVALMPSFNRFSDLYRPSIMA